MKNGRYNLEYYAPGIGVWFIDDYYDVEYGIIKSIEVFIQEDFYLVTYTILYDKNNTEYKVAVEETMIFEYKEQAQKVAEAFKQNDIQL